MFQSRLNTQRFEDYRWELRTTWNEIDRRAGLSHGWSSRLARSTGDTVSLETIDKVVNAIASLLREKGKAVPETLWFELVEVKVDLTASAGTLDQ